MSELIQTTECENEMVVPVCDENIFKEIRVDKDKERWYKHPDQIKNLENNSGSLYFDMKPYFKETIDPYTATNSDGWFESSTPIYRHNFECDVVLVTLRYYPEGTVGTGEISSIYENTIIVPKYIPNTNSIMIFKNGVRIPNSDFIEFSDTIVHFPGWEEDYSKKITDKDVIDVQYKTANLEEGVHYCSINFNIIRFESDEIFSTFKVEEMTVWGLRANKEALNPIKLIDKKSKVIVKTLQNWNPVYGYHFVEPFKNIDYARIDTTPKKFPVPEPSELTRVNGNKSQIFENAKGQTNFEITDFEYKIGNLDLFINGIKIPKSDFIENKNSFSLLTPMVSDMDELEACTWHPVKQSIQMFENIPSHENVINSKIFTVEFESEIGNLSVFLNGVKLVDKEFTQIDSNTFELNEPVKTDKDWVEVYAINSPYSICETFKINRNVNYFSDIKGFDSFLTNFSCVVGEARFYLNGLKMTSDDFIQTGIDSFDLTKAIRSSKDIVEIEAWYITDIKNLSLDVCDIDIFSKAERPDMVISNIRKDNHLKFDHRNLDQTFEDPAVYSNTPIENQDNKGFRPWSKERVGTIWLDTNHLHYKRYFDSKCFPDCTDRIKYWGELADFGECKVYEWVESDILPENWITAVNDTEAKRNTVESQNKSGEVIYHLFEKDDNDQWKIFDQTFEVFDAAIDGTDFMVNDLVDKCDASLGRLEISGKSFITSFTNEVDFRANYNVYVNGILRMENITIPDNQSVEVPDVLPADRIHIVRTPTDDEDIINDLIDIEALSREYQYTERSIFDEVGAKSTVYYFWVRNKNTKSDIPDKTMSVLSIEDELINTKSPYYFFQNTNPPKSVQYKSDYITLPWRMNGIIFTGLRGTIDADRRYTIQFTRDFTLRDSLNHGQYPLSLKNKHEEWTLFRKDQNHVIDRTLWNKVTESIISRKITNKNIPVPSYERQIYDTLYEDVTRFGLAEGEALTDGTLATNTILSYLKDRNNDFYPFRIDDFFTQHSFDTEEDIIAAMDEIFSLVPYNHVNNMFFSVLFDALSLKHEYPDIIKTSWVSLHSIALLNDQGRFDD